MKFKRLQSTMTMLFLSLGLLSSPFVMAKEIAITFDDSPRFAQGLLTGPERAKKLISNFLHSPKCSVFLIYEKEIRKKNLMVCEIC